MALARLQGICAANAGIASQTGCTCGNKRQGERADEGARGPAITAVNQTHARLGLCTFGQFAGATAKDLPLEAILASAAGAGRVRIALQFQLGLALGERPRKSRAVWNTARIVTASAPTS
jgi:hypothetical protein